MSDDPANVTEKESRRRERRARRRARSGDGRRFSLPTDDGGRRVEVVSPGESGVIRAPTVGGNAPPVAPPEKGLKDREEIVNQVRERVARVLDAPAEDDDIGAIVPVRPQPPILPTPRVPVGERKHVVRGALRQKLAERGVEIQARESASDVWWDEALDALLAFVRTHGHADVPPGHRCESGFRLGRWVILQRRARRQLAPDMAALLEAVPGWRWDGSDARWESALARLRSYAAENGHARIPARHREPDGFPLGRWATVQRQARQSGRLGPAHEAALSALRGWTWRDF